MNPTYSTYEVIKLIFEIDNYADLDRIIWVVMEEKKRYSLNDLYLINWVYKCRNLQIAS